jgi:hypothetical protein
MQIRWLFHVSCCAMLVTSIVEANGVTDARPRVLPAAENATWLIVTLPEAAAKAGGQP